MDIDKLDTFCLLMEHKTLADVATRKKLSVSGVQRQIASIEAEIGHKLFEKRHRLLKPTGKGEVFYQKSLDIIHEYKQALKDLDEGSAELTGSLVINSTPTAVSSWLASDLGSFINQNPNVRLSLFGSDKSIEQLKTECDVFIRPEEPKLHGFEQKPVKTFTFYLYASKKYVETNGYPKDIDDLEKHKIILYGSEKNMSIGGVNWYVKYLPQKFQNYVFINSGLGILKAIESSVGIGAISEYGINTYTKSQLVKVLPQLMPYKVDLFFIYPKNSLKKRHLENLYQYLKSLYA